jgi:8-amino-7-oxononanoate synthase
MMPSNIKKRLAEAREAGLYRSLNSCEYGKGRAMKINGVPMVDFASNDYLGLASDPGMAEASREAIERYGTGGRASRLICGNHPLYDALESATAEYKHTPAALVFSSGFILNTTVLPALAGKGDAIIADRLNHASLIDGAHLSGAKLLVYGHNDMESLEKALKRARDYANRLIVTDTVFSMDGDIAPLTQIQKLAEAYDAVLWVDEAHATGVIGPEGRGVVEAAGLAGKIDFVMGTYSKALGSLGAFVACGTEARDYLVNTARGLIFTTALPPAVLAASLRSVALAARADEARNRLRSSAQRARESLRGMGFDTGKSETQIIPVILGDEKKTVSASLALREKGFLVPAVRFPTVKKHGARLRISLCATHTEAELDGLVDAMRGL